MPGVRTAGKPLSGPELAQRNRRIAQALLHKVSLPDIRSRFGVGDITIEQVAASYRIDLVTREQAEP